MFISIHSFIVLSKPHFYIIEMICKTLYIFCITTCYTIRIIIWTNNHNSRKKEMRAFANYQNPGLWTSHLVITKIKLNVSVSRVRANNKFVILSGPRTVLCIAIVRLNMIKDCDDNEASNACQNLIITIQILISRFATCQLWENLSFVRGDGYNARWLIYLSALWTYTKKVRTN